eukprot:5697077-Pleurochrysis_carterae.AAC.1
MAVGARAVLVRFLLTYQGSPIAVPPIRVICRVSLLMITVFRQFVGEQKMASNERHKQRPFSLTQKMSASRGDALRSRATLLAHRLLVVAEGTPVTKYR